QTQSRIGFLHGANQRPKRREGLIGPSVKGAGDDGFPQCGALTKGAKEFHIALELLLLIGEDLAPTEEELGAQQSDTLAAQFGSGTRAIHITHVGTYVHACAIRSRTRLAAPELL